MEVRIYRFLIFLTIGSMSRRILGNLEILLEMRSKADIQRVVVEMERLLIAEQCRDFHEKTGRCHF